MSLMIKNVITGIAFAAVLALTACSNLKTDVLLEKNSQGFAPQENFQAIYDEIDYHRATQLYLWATPMIVSAGARGLGKYHADGQENLVSVAYYKDKGTAGILTANDTVRYIIIHGNIAESGPLVVESPAGMHVGIIDDNQYEYVTQYGLVGPKGSKVAEKLLVLGPESKRPANTKGYRVVRSKTNKIMMGTRILRPVKDAELGKQFVAYPWKDRANPVTKYVEAKKDGDVFLMTSFLGMDYWRELHKNLQDEPVQREDLYMMAWLKNLGIEKGKPFNPTARQTKILKKAATMAEQMSPVMSFATRNPKARYRDDSTWVFPLMINVDHMDETGNFKQFNQRVDWFWEAFGLAPAMKSVTPGKGSAYLGAYRDLEGEWLNGSENYTMHIEAGAPMKRFWAVTMYNLRDRTLLLNGTNKMEINSMKKDLIINEDGSVDLYFGPEAPEGKTPNHIKTNRDVLWFVYFRLYGPTEAYFDRSWKMNDIKKGYK